MIFLPVLLLFAAGPADDLPSELKRFTDVLAKVEQNAAEPVSPDKAIYEGAIPGMLRRLDPHSVFFDPGQFEQLKELQRSTRKGFGSVVSVLPGRVIVLQTLPGTPSARSGIMPGDEILAVNGIPLSRLDTEQLVGLLGQSRQGEARLDVRRPGNARLLQFNMTPEEMQAPSVERAFHLLPGVGYLRVASFDAETGKRIKDAIEKLGGAQLRGLVLDLRNNPGGFLPAALETASLFLKPGTQILSVRGRSVQGKEENVAEGVKPYAFPVAVLINGKSASASEIVAGALQDHDRGVIVGETSYGKGLVESVYPLSQQTGLALTTSYYYTPSGRSIQKPLKAGQIQGPSVSEREQQHREFRTDAGRPVRGGGGIQPDEVVYPDPITRLQAVLDASGSFASFATEYLRGNKADHAFEATNQVLDQFQSWAAQRNIQPGIAEWSRDREWIRNRLKTEILNQAVGVEKGDEVEAQRDPVIRAALRRMGVGDFRAAR